MQIVNLYPPNYALIKTILPVEEKHQPIFCFGNIIYNPFNINITPDREVHEGVHKRQQGKDIEGWWTKYLNDRGFRLEQEIEAFGTQYHFAKKYVSGKLLDWAKEKMAEALSGEQYGSLLTYGEAVSKIRNFKCSK